LRLLYTSYKSENGGKIHRIKFKDAYDNQIRSPNNIESYEFLRSAWYNINEISGDSESIVINYASKVCDGVCNNLSDNLIRNLTKSKDCSNALAKWLTSASELKEINLLIGLSATVLLWYLIDSSTTGDLFAELCFLAQNMAHEEFILGNWLMLEYSENSMDLRNRLNRLSLGGTDTSQKNNDDPYIEGGFDDTYNGQLTEHQIEKLKATCYGIRSRTRDNRNLIPSQVALCLLYAVNDVTEADKVELDEILRGTICRKLGQLKFANEQCHIKLLMQILNELVTQEAVPINIPMTPKLNSDLNHALVSLQELLK
jgi:hypothetical protein